MGDPAVLAVACRVCFREPPQAEVLRKDRRVRHFPTKVLLAADGFEEAELAALRAAELAHTTHSELHVVHVGCAPAVLMAEPGTRGYDRTLREQLEDEAGELLRKLTWRVKVAGGEVAGDHRRMGIEDLEIVGLAERLGRT